MKTIIKLFISSMLVFSVSSAGAAIISWDSGDPNYIGLRDSSTGEVGCSAGDICATTQTWNLGGGLTVTAEGYDSGLGSGSVDDNNRIVLWHDANPAVGGLGSAPGDQLGDSSKDNNQDTESIHIWFNMSVFVDKLFFNGDHISIEDHFWVADGTTNLADNAFATDGMLAIGAWVTDLFIEPDFDFLPADEWYLSGVEFTERSVPEPSTLMLLSLGLLGIFFGGRRRKI